MKGVFLSLEPKALVGTKQDTQSVLLSNVFFSPLLKMRLCLVCIQKNWFCASLFCFLFCFFPPPQQPTLLIVQRGESVKHGNFSTFLGYFQILLLALETGGKGTLR